MTCNQPTLPDISTTGTRQFKNDTQNRHVRAFKTVVTHKNGSDCPSCFNMVLGILTSLAACPAIVGTTEAVRQGQRTNKKEEHRGRKSNLLVTCSDPSRKARDIHGGTIVLRDNKVRRIFKLHIESRQFNLL